MLTANQEFDSDQLAPHDINSEEAVLGSILYDPDALFDVLAFLKPDDFFIVRHSWIYEAILRVHERRETVDYVTITNELRENGRLQEVGGEAYIVNLVNRTPSSLGAESYGRIVERTALRRRLIEAASNIVRIAHSDETDINDVIGQSEQAIFDVTERRLGKDLIPIREIASEYFDHVSMMSRHQEEVMGVPSGFKDLDTMLGGFQKSDLLIIAARPGMGKSSWLNNILLNAARQGQRVALFSLEMSNEQLVQRLISGDTAIPSDRLRLGKLNDREWDKFITSTDHISELPIHLDDTPALSTTEVRTKARRLHLEYGLDLIMIDYLQLMTTPFRTENRVQEISYISRALKQLARELNIPVIAAAQLSRAVEQRTDKRPLLSDLRESGSIEQDSDIVMFIYRDKYYNADSPEGDKAEIIISKHRNGPVGTVNLLFIPELTQFRNAKTRSIDLDQLG